MTQQAHYDRIADVFVRNLDEPQTEEYSALFDRLLCLPWLRHTGLQVVGAARKPVRASSDP